MTATDNVIWDGCFGTLPVGSAPISWGACEVPGWGPMPDADTALSEMAALGLRGTELGAPGFLPADPGALRATLEHHRLRFIGSFTPLVLHEADPAPALAQARAVIELLGAAGGEVLIGAVVQDLAWSAPQALDDTGWAHLAEHAGAVAALCAEHGVGFALHPHVGTLLLAAADVERAVAQTGPEVGWCLDTGHLMIGGTSPVAFAAAHGDRVTHVHLKDVDADLAAAVAAERISLLDATRQGLFTPLGRGAAGIGAVLGELQAHEYTGWLVLEQDTTADGDDGRAMRDARESIRYLETLQREEERGR